MSVVQVRQQLHQYIDVADERILRALFAMLQNYLEKDEEIIGFNPDGQPITRKALLQSLTNALADVEQGKGLSTEDIRREKQNW